MTVTRSTIQAQIAECNRELGQRRHVYPRLIESGKLTQAAADRQTKDLTDAVHTLEFVQKYAVPLRTLIETLQRYNPYEDKVVPEAEIDRLLQQPEVREVMRVFPDTIITASRKIDGTGDLFASEGGE